jgi:ADP-ribosyl-[dinitrogen reductase] hydrolase
MQASAEVIQAGMLGLLIGDACGVPYEFRHPDELPPMDQIEMAPPRSFLRTYAHVPLGSWSDDGAQALCLYVSLQACGQYHPHDFASRLIRWFEEGYMAVNNYVFDIGNQTSESIARLRRGSPTRFSGLRGERNNGNGSLMRSLPLALLHRGNDFALVTDAHRQSSLTHGHLRSQACCALYCLWARRTLQEHKLPWNSAVSTLREIYRGHADFLHELDVHIRPEDLSTAHGTGYVVDSLKSAVLASTEPSYRRVVQRAIAFGNDTDTTACIAGGIAALREGLSSIPGHWHEQLLGKEILRKLELY